MSYFNLKSRVDFLGHVKNIIISILFFTVDSFIILCECEEKFPNTTHNFN